MIKVKISYIILVIVSMLFAIIYVNYFPILLLALVLFLPMFLFITLVISWFKIEINIKNETLIVNKDEKIEIQINATNKSIFPIKKCRIYLSYKNLYSNKKFKKVVEANLDSKESLVLNCILQSSITGKIQVKIEKIKIYDYLSLFSLRKKMYQMKPVIVLPNIYEINRQKDIDNEEIFGEGDSFSTIKPGDDPSEVFNIREYKPSDKIQKIHWKLSIKKQDLMVKEFSLPISKEDIIIVDLDTKNQSIKVIEGILETIASLSALLNNLNRHHYILYNDFKDISNNEDTIEAIKSIINSNEGMQYIGDLNKDNYKRIFFVTGSSSIDKLKEFQSINETILCIYEETENKQIIDGNIKYINSNSIKDSIENIVL